jgi:magnesium-transporting ATPase (P-type)
VSRTEAWYLDWLGRASSPLLCCRRNRWKLLLHCIMIITAVVPPELPIELALAVNLSVTALMRVGVFCTEPWRITLAGRVDIACFDKTGTITADEFHVDGIVVLLDGAEESGSTACAQLMHPCDVPSATRQVGDGSAMCSGGSPAFSSTRYATACLAAGLNWLPLPDAASFHRNHCNVINRYCCR